MLVRLELAYVLVLRWTQWETLRLRLSHVWLRMAAILVVKSIETVETVETVEWRLVVGRVHWQSLKKARGLQMLFSGLWTVGDGELKRSTDT